MNSVLVLNERIENYSNHKVVPAGDRTVESQTVLIATIDPDICDALTELLKTAKIKAIWSRSVNEVKSLIVKQEISACLCGLWLQDGTYREIVRHLRNGLMDIPAIIVSAPSCPQNFRDYLAAMNLGTLEVLTYPYQQSDLDRLLTFAIPSRSDSVSKSVLGAGQPFEVRGAA